MATHVAHVSHHTIFLFDFFFQTQNSEVTVEMQIWNLYLQRRYACSGHKFLIFENVTWRNHRERRRRRLFVNNQKCTKINARLSAFRT